MVDRIVSGGQTGADRAAFDAALELGLTIGGWVPEGRWAEDGAVPAQYPNLRQAESRDPAVRTEFNVRDSDATLLLSHGELRGGTALAMKAAERLGRPRLHLDLTALSDAEAIGQLREWLARERPRVLNVAGPRASEDPEIYAAAKRILVSALPE